MGTENDSDHHRDAGTRPETRSDDHSEYHHSERPRGHSGEGRSTALDQHVSSPTAIPSDRPQAPGQYSSGLRNTSLEQGAIRPSNSEHQASTNPQSAEVTIYVRHMGEGGHSSFGDAGHVMLQVREGTRQVGFDYFSIGGRSIVQTHLEELDQNASARLTIPISSEQAQNMIARIHDLAAHVPEYHLPYLNDAASTCVTRSLEVLRTGGIDLGHPLWPADVQVAAERWLTSLSSSSAQTMDAGVQAVPSNTTSIRSDEHNFTPLNANMTDSQGHAAHASGSVQNERYPDGY